MVVSTANAWVRLLIVSFVVVSVMVGASWMRDDGRSRGEAREESALSSPALPTAHVGCVQSSPLGMTECR